MNNIIKSSGLAGNLNRIRFWLALRLIKKPDLITLIRETGIDEGKISTDKCLYCKKYVPHQRERNNPGDFIHPFDNASMGFSCPFCDFWITILNRLTSEVVWEYRAGRKELFEQAVNKLQAHIDKGKNIDWFDKYPYVVKDEASCDAHWKEYNKWPQFTKKNEK